MGSFTAEALARAGVGRLTLVDGERVEETNANRQLHALEGTVGRPRAEVMAERLRAAAPGAEIAAVAEAYGPGNEDRLVPAGLSFVVDAMDTVTAKLLAVARCLRLGVPRRDRGRGGPADRPDRGPGDGPLRDPHRSARQGSGWPARRRSAGTPLPRRSWRGGGSRGGDPRTAA